MSCFYCEVVKTLLLNVVCLSTVPKCIISGLMFRGHSVHYVEFTGLPQQSIILFQLKRNKNILCTNLKKKPCFLFTNNKPVFFILSNNNQMNKTTTNSTQYTKHKTLLNSTLHELFPFIVILCKCISNKEFGMNIVPPKIDTWSATPC